MTEVTLSKKKIGEKTLLLQQHKENQQGVRHCQDQTTSTSASEVFFFLSYKSSLPVPIDRKVSVPTHLVQTETKEHMQHGLAPPLMTG